jgi:hypothetical protein
VPGERDAGESEVEYRPDLLFDRLRALELTPGEYAVFGSGPLAVRGLIDKVRDLDVIVRGETWHQLKDLGVVVMQGADETVHLGNGLTFGRSWGYGVFDIEKLIDDAEIIEGLPFVQLDAVIEFKKIADRPKDREHLSSLRESGLV